MLCNFRPLRTTGRWELLERTAGRCGPGEALATTTARYGEPVAVPKPPQPNDVVIAHVDGLDASGVELVKSLAYKPAPRYVAFDDGPQYRLVTATAADGLLVSAPSGFDYPGKFAMSPQARTLTFTKEDAPASSSGDLRVEFEAIPVHGAQGSARGDAPTSRKT
jgi:hypothetical protein